MIIASIVLGISILLCELSVIWSIKVMDRRIQSKLRSWENTFVSQAEKLAANEPCEAGTILGQIGRLIGSQAGTSAKAAIMADLSHASREANTLATDQAIEGVAAANPALGGLLAGMGGRKAGKLLSNPLIQLALQGLQSRGNSGNIPADGGYTPTRKHRE